MIAVPSASETRTVRSAKTIPASGSSPPSALSALASPSPAKSPTTEASSPMTRPSMTTARMTCRRDAPRVRSVANSRVRWATVIDRVLKITNAPTNSAIAPKPSRKRRSAFTMTFVSCASAAACCSASLTSRLGGTSGRTARSSSSVEVPSFALIEMPSNRPSFPSTVWAVVRSQTAIVAAPSESTSPKVAMPVTL